VKVELLARAFLIVSQSKTLLLCWIVISFTPKLFLL
jgi:hypothetical protein